MSSIVTSILSSTVGLLWNKVRDSTADKLKDGDVADAEIRKIVVADLDDITSNIDGISTPTLLASYDFLREGIDLLNVSLDESNPEQKASGTQDKSDEPSSDIPSVYFNQAVKLTRAMEKLKINSGEEFKTAKKRFEVARMTATTAFRNEAFSIEDRIFAAKLQIVSEILEHLDSPETAITGCLSFLKTLHSLPAIQEVFTVYLNGGVKSLFNKVKRVENVKSVMLINYVLFQYVWKFSSRHLFEVSACMPTIELSTSSFYPIINWYEISTRKSMGEELPTLNYYPPNTKFLDEKIEPYKSAVNSQGDVLTLSLCDDNIIFILKTGKLTRVEVPEFGRYFPLALAVDINDNVYVVSMFLNGGFLLTILDENFNVKAENRLDSFQTEDASRKVRIAICENNDIILQEPGFFYVFDKTGQFKYNFKHELSLGFSLSISQQNEIMIPTRDHTAVEIYTKEGSLKRTIKVPDDHEVLSVAFHYVVCKILVLTMVRKSNFCFILRYPEAGEELKILSLFDSGKHERYSRLLSHPNGSVVVVREESITYL
ncbi:uncharacterized protein LOC114539284 [Dendronephthya gigantea]|uniref:uncharacterized protein LOC114539284 n=1 Tax=Dendronephthya gigantea TaxID=151771 RepID=UPI00106BA0FB|nr:uncharacterized protein LOC114539284 [Dendronephthya gigantea]